MKVVFDASALAKRYIEDEGSEEVQYWLQQTSQLALCILCIPEIISALNRQRREGNITTPQYEQIKRALQADIADVVILNLSPTVIETSTLLLENNVLRAMDALHVATALVWGAERLVSADARQLQAAQNAGLKVERV